MDRCIRGAIGRAGRAGIPSYHQTPAVGARISNGLDLLGIDPAEKRNVANCYVASAAAGSVAVGAIRADEERMIAKMVSRILSLGGKKGIER